MSKIIVAGSINMDVVTQAERHPQPGETLFGRDLQFIPGGKGANQAVAAARVGGDVYLLGKLGQDGFGAQLIDFLQAESLNIDYVTFADKTASGTALIVVNQASENTIVVIPGSNAELTVADVSDVMIDAGDIAVAPFEVPQETILSLFRRVKKAGGTTILNPAPATKFIDGLKDVVDVLIVNETELAFFAGDSVVYEDTAALQKQAESIRSREEQIIIITLGAKGIFCVAGDDVFQSAGRDVKAVDTTAAGDCFTGSLAVALSEGKALKDALTFANIAASLSVQKAGASSSLPHRADVEAILTSGSDSGHA